MKKSTSIIIVSILVLVGSLVTFFANNLLMAVICNGSAISAVALAIFPFFVVALDVVALTIFMFRLYKEPEHKKALIKHYSLLIFIFSCVGFVFSYVVGEWVYDSFTVGPFSGYSAVMFSVNLLLAVLSGVVRFIIVNKIKDDKEAAPKRGAKYVFFNILLSLGIYYAYNKFGAVLYTPVYAQTRTLYMTWIFYLTLVTPILVMILNGLYFFDVFKGNKKALLITTIALLSVVLVLNIATICVGANNPKFIAAVSFAVPLERLGSFPFDAIFRPLIGLGMGTNLLLVALKK